MLTNAKPPKAAPLPVPTLFETEPHGRRALKASA
jgi:hypothetical protein